ncbi:post-GPI attachment to proteins factor 3 [Culicoides brevitarsis]|uniref:post-GPI attachment to proteins factor 3 n=1 Tax=Culicoides brevitarsis TaxID=469753 RepID=UPI00307B38D0
MRENSQFLLLAVVFSSFLAFSVASPGDRSPYYQNCVERCFLENCTADPLDCDCKYECMWRTVDKFVERGWKIPQFHGKWPFVRVLGMQEPASVIFSIFNLLMNVYGICKFRKEVSPQAPYWHMWHFSAAICINGWIWSTVFHTNDTPTTELLDYGCAYMIVISSFYCMVARIAALYKKNVLYRVLLAGILAIFYVNHFTFLMFSQDYGYNMKVNIITGTSAGVGWIVWYFGQRHDKPYAYKIAIFVVLNALSLGWEVFDFPPWWKTFDAHSLWHFCTAPLVILYYSFIIDDCKYLHEREKTKKQ